MHLPTRQGDYAVYETADGRTRYHFERTSQATLYGVELVTEGVTFVPRDRAQLVKLVAKFGLKFVEMGR